MPFSTTTEAEPSQAPKGHLELNKDYANIQLITDSNFAPDRIYHNCSWNWVTDVLLADSKLPVPFDRNLISSNDDLWERSPGVSNFRKLPDLSNQVETQDWLNYLGNSVGVLHGVIKLSEDDKRIDNIAPGDRSFDCEGSDKPLDSGLIKRKPDIVAIDRVFRHHVEKSTRLGWPLVQSLIEISADPRRSYNATIKNILEKAANVF